MAPKYTRTKVTGKIGALFVDGVVTAHGSILRMVHEEDDVGIDGFIELVNAESASGRIVAVQIKGGDSYVASSGDAFLISVDDSHLQYWQNHMVPVIIVGYSPSRNLAAWTPVRVKHETYHGRTPITSIRIPFYRTFDTEAIATGITGLAAAHFDKHLLIRAVDKCLSEVPDERHQAIQLLANHPDSRHANVVSFFARRLLADPSREVAKTALEALGRNAGVMRWSWNPMSKTDFEIQDYALSLCNDLKSEDIRRLLELCDEESFYGPDALGERLLDISGGCADAADEIFHEIARDQSQPLQRRCNAWIISSESYQFEPEEEKARLEEDPGLRDLVPFFIESDTVSSSHSAADNPAGRP